MQKFLIIVAAILLLPAMMLSAQTFVDDQFTADGTEKIQTEFRHPKTLIDKYYEVKNHQTDAGISLNPGIDPDGDEQGFSTFTNDGTKVISTNGLTNNITIFDWESQTAITNLDVGMYPTQVSVSDDYAVVSCLLDSTVHIIDLNDYSTAAIKQMPGQTFSSTMSPDGSKVYVHYYYEEFSGVKVISLDDFSELQTIGELPPVYYLSSWVTGSGRNNYKFFTFDISFANNILIFPDGEENVYFYDLETGDLISSVPGIKAYEGDLSLDENTYVTITIDNPGVLYQIDVATQSIISVYADLTIGYWAGSLSCNHDGTRAFFGGDNSGHIVDFAANTHDVFATNTAFYSATTADKRYVYSSNYKASVLDFDTKSIVGIHQGNTQGYVCVSPVGNQAFAYNSLFWEGGFFYDFSSLSSLDYLGKQFFGNPPEGDITFTAAINPAGTKGIVANPGSWTVSIVDLVNNEVTSVLDVGESCKYVEITHDGNYATVSGHDLNSIKIIDMNTEEIIAIVPTGQRPGNMVISPDDQYVYVMNIKGNTISKVLLDGANSTELQEINCGVIGGYYAAYGLYSDLTITPDGEYIIACITLEGHVKVIKTEDMSTVATLSTGDGPVNVALNTDGDYATCVNYGGSSYTVMHIDGANSSIVGTYSGGMLKPIRVKYNAVLDQMMIVDYQHQNLQWQVVHTNPETGDVIEVEVPDGFGANYDIGYNSNGDAVILTGAAPLENNQFGDCHVVVGDEGYIIGDGPISFAVNPDANVALCACGGGGQDFVSIVHMGETLLPSISVDTDLFSFAVDSAQVDSDEFTISNDGEGELSFSISYDYLTEFVNNNNTRITQLNDNVTIDGLTATSTKPAYVTFTSKDELLWDNTNINVGTQGIVSVELGGITPDGRAISSDDFIIPESESWTLSYVYTEGFSNQVVVPDAFAIALYMDDNDKPGEVFHAEEIIPANGIDFGVQEMYLAEPLDLEGGHYWISVYAVYNEGTTLDETRWNWRMGSVPVGSTACLNDYAGLFGLGAGWNALPDIGVDYESLYFQLRGEKSGSTAWLSISESNGTVAPGDDFDVEVSVDATGLSAGTYEAMIKINSNDPTNPVIEIPVEMVVSTGVGINENEQQVFSIWPNPATETLNISGSEDIGTITVYTQTGSVVKTVNAKNTAFSFHINDFMQGIYFIKIENTAGTSSTIKFIKK
jgi:DNA-binding beta-propeller fold protein YncE